MSELFEAIVNDDFARVESIITTSKDAVYQTDTHHKMTPLHYAAYHNKPTIADFLIDNGCDIDQIDMFGCTPLHWACRNGSLDACVILLDRGADINHAKWNKNEERTPLHFACIEGHIDIINILIDRGANPNLIWFQRGYKRREFLKKYPDTKDELTSFDCCRTEECREALLKRGIYSWPKKIRTIKQ